MKEFNIHETKAKDIMSKKLVTIECHEEISVALGKMREHDVHELPVTDDGKIIGLVSYDTFLKRRNIPLTTKVENVMSFPPRLSPDISIMDVAEMMLSSGYRAVPVTKDEKIVGLVSRADLVGVIPDMDILRHIKVKEIMTHNPRCVEPDDTIDTAKSLMNHLDVRALPVIDEDSKIIGMVGLRDITDSGWRKKQKTGRGGGGESKPVKINISSVMNIEPVCVDEDQTITEAVHLMLDNGISTIIVSKHDVPIGIVTQYDLMELIASFQKKEGVYVQISGLDIEDSDAYDPMYELIQKSMKRMGKLVKPKMFTIHVSTHAYGSEEHAGRYQLSGRMTSEHEMFYAHATDWDLLRCLSDLLSQLDRMIRKDKSKKDSRHKRG
ncbi:MAG: CBS domain-containing protein [Thermoplasmata archaeon]|nr:CBS domain-containing protein [Thermoplasmata archaeon]